MQLTQKVKTCLDETRMLVMGAQILLGFGLHGAFADAFDRLSPHAWSLFVVTLGLLVLVLGLLVLPGPYHRIVEHGADSNRLHALVTRVADLSLFPFALALAMGVFIAGERIAGTTTGVAAGAGAASIAIALWYGLPWLRSRSLRRQEHCMPEQPSPQRQETPLHVKIEQMLTEARVILPGAQALFGFQLSIVLTRAFEELPDDSRLAHGASLAFVAASVMLLMAPAAYHRLVFAGEDREEMHRVGSIMVTLATLPLAIGLAGDLYVIVAKVAASSEAGIAAAGCALVLLFGLWYAYPFAALAMRQRQTPVSEPASPALFD